jgi:hypothetical protein
MPIESIIGLLLAERQRIDAALSALQGSGSSKRRGRPAAKLTDAPVWVKGPVKKVAVKKHGRTYTPAQRAEQAARMKKFWAAKKKAVGKAKPKKALTDKG